MSASATPQAGVEALQILVDTVASFITQAEAEVTKTATGQESPEESNAHDKPELDALRLAGDSAALIRAHSTKISLLMINEPFTPSAISKVLRDLLKDALPGLISATQLCVPARYTATFRQDLAWRCGRVLKELRELILRIPKDGKILSGVQKNGDAGLGGDKGSLAATGLLWAACDEVTRLTKGGVAGHLIQKVEQYRDTLKDVMEELKEWGEETDEDDEDGLADVDDEDGVADDLAASHISTQAMLDDLMNSHRHIPADDPDNIRQRLDSCLRRLRLTSLLYQAVIKRRLKTLPALPTSEPSVVCARLDEVMPILKDMPDGFGDVAAAFYELSAPEIDEHMDQRFLDAFAASEMLLKPWGDAQKDEFTEWALRFQVEVKKNS